jgi:hypothetical protein
MPSAIVLKSQFLILIARQFEAVTIALLIPSGLNDAAALERVTLGKRLSIA